tara:strand:+ start:211 stop:1170 length:960 start_codon:yes stop_codon:yes gene_type:complete
MQGATLKGFRVLYNKNNIITSLKRAFGLQNSKTKRKTRLGDLLVRSNIISKDQLLQALALQKQSGNALGHILCDLGFLSKTQLYGVLGRQSVLRFSAAALGTILALGAIVTPIKNVRAETFRNSETNVQRASLFRVPDIDVKRDQSKLFGYNERQSSNLAAFTKWNDAVQKMQASYQYVQNQSWQRDIQRYAHLPLQERIARVNDYVNGFRYIEDQYNYGVSDYWATPSEFFRNRAGDCEDFALAKYEALSMLGIPKDQMRLAIVHDKIRDIPHAVLIVYLDEGSLVLDNQIKVAMDSSKINRYKPIYSINETAWWRHS